MFQFTKTRSPIGFVFLLLAFSVLLSGCTTGSITPNSQVSQKISNNVAFILIVNTNFPEKGMTIEQASSSLMMEQFGISTNLAKSLSDAGVKNSSLYIKKMELDPAAFLERAITTKNPTHLLQVTVPNGTFRNKSLMAEKYSVQVILTDAKTKAVVWKYVADVNAGREAHANNVAASVIASMRHDGLISITKQK